MRTPTRFDLIALALGGPPPAPEYRPRASGNADRDCVDGCGRSSGPGRPGRRCPECRTLHDTPELRRRADAMGIACWEAAAVLDRIYAGEQAVVQEPGTVEQRASFWEHCRAMVVPEDGRAHELTDHEQEEPTRAGFEVVQVRLDGVPAACFVTDGDGRTAFRFYTRDELLDTDRKTS